MKIKHLFSVLFAAAAVLAGCEKPVDFGDPSLTISQYTAEVPMDGGSVTVKVNATRDWVVRTDADWVIVDPESGKASFDDVTVTITAPANTGVDRTADIEFYGGKLACESITLTQKGPGGDPGAAKSVTCAEFASMPDDDGTIYRLEGTISGSINTQYGNFDVVDASGSVYVYGCTNVDEYVDMLKKGNEIIVEGPKTTYNGKVEMKNATIISIEQGQGGTPTDIKDVTCAQFIAADVSSTEWYRLKGTVSGSINTQYGNFDIVDATGSVFVYGTENFSEYASDFAKGDKVTFVGQRGDYNGKVEVLNGYIEKYEKGEGEKPIEGTNIIKNGGFEEWGSDKPSYWSFKSGNATLAKSTDAYQGSYSVEIQGDETSNKRLMSDVYTLKAGTYQISAFIKGSGQFRLGYAVVTNGSIADTKNDYKYITDAAPASSEWKIVFEKFTLTEQTDISLIVMNSSKGGGESVFVDELALVTNDGGVIDGGHGGGDENVQTITCAEFIQKADPNTTYRLVGEVVSDVNSSYCSFDMNDGTAKVVVWTVNNKDEWKEVVKKGGIVTVRGKYQLYTDKDGNTKDEMIDAYIEAFEPGQGGDTPGDIQHGATTVAAFNAAAVSTTDWYQLTGKISGLAADDPYGNFNITDETGFVYVYGVLSEKGGEKQKFQELVQKHGIANGGTITINATRGEYNGTVEAVNAYFVSYVPGEPEAEVKGLTLTFPDDNKDNNSVSAYTESWSAKKGSASWEISNFNNNKWANNWTYIKCGRKNNASVAYIATSSPVSSKVTKVVVSIDKCTTQNVNSTNMVVAKDASFTDIVETVEVGIAVGNLEYKVSAPAEGLYYKLVYDCSPASANGVIQISKIVYAE